MYVRKYEVPQTHLKIKTGLALVQGPTSPIYQRLGMITTAKDLIPLDQDFTQKNWWDEEII